LVQFTGNVLQTAGMQAFDSRDVMDYFWNPSVTLSTVSSSGSGSGSGSGQFIADYLHNKSASLLGQWGDYVTRLLTESTDQTFRAGLNSNKTDDLQLLLIHMNLVEITALMDSFTSSGFNVHASDDIVTSWFTMVTNTFHNKHTSNLKYAAQKLNSHTRSLQNQDPAVYIALVHNITMDFSRKWASVTENQWLALYNAWNPWLPQEQSDVPQFTSLINQVKTVVAIFDYGLTQLVSVLQNPNITHEMMMESDNRNNKRVGFQGTDDSSSTTAVAADTIIQREDTSTSTPFAQIVNSMGTWIMVAVVVMIALCAVWFCTCRCYQCLCVRVKSS